MANIIKKMKASSSPCPFDQISVLVLKKCPIVRTYVWKLLEHCWEKSLIPELWKKGLTVLAYKKGLADDAANFQPITLEPVIAKVLTSLIRNRISAFLCKNQYRYIETNIQNGFWTGISGTIEHTELMSHPINHARQKQRSLVVTLIDLKNAFGEAHHELICAVLRFHHIPRSIEKFILQKSETVTVACSSLLSSSSPTKTWRHNWILLTIARFLSVPANSRGMKLFVDLDGYPNP